MEGRIIIKNPPFHIIWFCTCVTVKQEELADVLVYSQNMLDKLGLDADEIVNAKMSQNETKYPVDKAKGNAAKYTDL